MRTRAAYNMQYRVDDGAWVDWLTGTTATSAGGFTGEMGHVYYFRVRTWDNVGNERPYPDTPDAVTRIQAPITRYYYANGQRVAMRQGDVVYYVHTDHLGSTSLTTDQNQQVVARQLYHPYGTPRWSQGTLPTDYTFTGQRLDGGIGLMHYGARFYSPRLGRFVSPDTIVPDPLSPQDLNRYTYTRNNPLAYIDRDGHQVLPVIIGLVVVGFIAYDYLAHPDIAYAPGPDVDVSALPPSDLPDNDAAICSFCPYAERGQWGMALVMGAIEVTPVDEIPGVSTALRKALKEGGEEAAEELAEQGAKAAKRQWHHILSRPIMEALDEHPTLRSIFRRRDQRLIYQAADDAAHRGWQTWHRQIDDEVAKWLTKNPEATPEDFLRFLQEVYERPEVRARIPGVDLTDLIEEFGQ